MFGDRRPSTRADRNVTYAKAILFSFGPQIEASWAWDVDHLTQLSRNLPRKLVPLTWEDLRVYEIQEGQIVWLEPGRGLSSKSKRRYA